jgi:hypothetical protein
MDREQFTRSCARFERELELVARGLSFGEAELEAELEANDDELEAELEAELERIADLERIAELALPPTLAETLERESHGARRWGGR